MRTRNVTWSDCGLRIVAFDAAPLGQVEIQEHHIGADRWDYGESLLAITSRRHDSHVRQEVKQTADALAHQGLVLDETNGNRARTAPSGTWRVSENPAPRRDSTARVPPTSSRRSRIPLSRAPKRTDSTPRPSSRARTLTPSPSSLTTSQRRVAYGLHVRRR